ncbi:MAG: hypothetical protein KAU14_08310 [Thermoplasmata archaeon]|nr:hypothetical protein [Thermoplasmata archaeon]
MGRKLLNLITLIFISGFILFLLLFGVSSVSGRIITVDNDGGDYENIQDAVDAAGEGDTIRVRCYDGQDNSKVITIIVTVENKDDGGDGGDDDGGGGFIPGFEAVASIGALLIGLLFISSYPLPHRVKKKS